MTLCAMSSSKGKGMGGLGLEPIAGLYTLRCYLLRRLEAKRSFVWTWAAHNKNLFVAGDERRARALELFGRVDRRTHGCFNARRDALELPGGGDHREHVSA